MSLRSARGPSTGQQRRGSARSSQVGPCAFDPPNLCTRAHERVWDLEPAPISDPARVLARQGG
jgi:hypothetical protein